jgi:hypothetical protein
MREIELIRTASGSMSAKLTIQKVMEGQMRTSLLALFAGAAVLAGAAVSTPATAAGLAGLHQAAGAPESIVTRVDYYRRRAYGCCGPRYRHHRPAAYGYYRRPVHYPPAVVVYYPPPVVYYPPPVVSYAYAPPVAPYRTYGYGYGYGGGYDAPYASHRYHGAYYGW